MSRPSVVMRPTTAVHPEGSLKKLGSEAGVSVESTNAVVKAQLSYLLASPHPSSRMPPSARPRILPSLNNVSMDLKYTISDLERTIRLQS